mgnify:CR=1 FL=1
MPNPYPGAPPPGLPQQVPYTGDQESFRQRLYRYLFGMSRAGTDDARLRSLLGEDYGVGLTPANKAAVSPLPPMPPEEFMR